MAGATPQTRVRTGSDRTTSGGLDTEGLRVAHLDAVLSACSDGVLFLGRGGRVISWNEAAEHVLAPAGQLVEDAPMAQFFVDGDQFSQLLARALDGEVVSGHRIDVASSDGRPGPVRLTLLPIHDKVVRGHYGFLSSPSSLGCTAVLKDLREIEELRRVEAIKDEFLATASHELRTPLTSIVGFAELLSQVVPEQISLTAPIERNAREMRRLVEGLLDQARLESGKVTIEPTRFGLQPAVQELLDELNPAPGNIRLEIPHELQILMDVEAFSRVLGNLVSNAAKYAADSQITISARQIEGHIEVSVADDGPGIPLEDQENLFDPFFRAPGASRTARGSGFGLSIVRRYLELHGGDVECQSGPGQGTTFTFRVPDRPGLHP